MKGGAREWETRLRDNAQRSTVRRRNRPAVAILAVLTVILLLAGVLTDLQVGSPSLAITCYVAAALVGNVLLAFLYVKRLWVTRPPER